MPAASSRTHLVSQRPAEVVEARCDVGMIFAESFLAYFERAFVQRLGLVVLSLRNAVSAISKLNNLPGILTTRRGCGGPLRRWDDLRREFSSGFRASVRTTARPRRTCPAGRRQCHQRAQQPTWESNNPARLLRLVATSGFRRGLSSGFRASVRTAAWPRRTFPVKRRECHERAQQPTWDRDNEARSLSAVAVCVLSSP